MKCVNCKNCIAYEEGYYWCCFGEEYTPVEECIANDDNMPCDLYVQDSHDDFTEE